MTVKADDIGSLRERVSILERDMTVQKADMHALHAELRTNTAITTTVHKELSDLISLLKGGKVVGKFLSWGAGIITALGAIWLFFVGK